MLEEYVLSLPLIINMLWLILTITTLQYTLRRGPLSTWSVTNGSVMNGSVMNMVCFQQVCYEWVCCERGLF